MGFLSFAILALVFGIIICFMFGFKTFKKTTKELKRDFSLIEKERGRIASDMHDGLAQSIYSMILGLDVCLKFIDKDIDDTKIRLIELRELANRSLKETRQYIYNLSPDGLSEKGLVDTLESYCKTFSKIDGMDVNLIVNGNERYLNDEVERTFYQIAREALGNAAKHGEADKITVNLSFEDDSTFLIVEDDGDGFDVDRALRSSDWDNRKMGLTNIKNRVELHGGAYSIDSLPGKGTKIAVKIPS
jgi:two-component system sensor histidine kinase DegS